MTVPFQHPFTPPPDYQKRVAYFCMEYAIHQPLKIYAGGLGFLAGSYLRSAYDLRQNLVAIGILWKYGYYDQIRKSDQTMDILFQEKVYGFLEPTNIKFTIRIFQHDVWVTAWYLPPETFHTAPLFLLSTNLPENDYLAQTISHKLYDFNPETKLAASILLGVGGARLLEKLSWTPEIYHLNESHALPLAFYLYDKLKSLQKVKQQLVFTNHTPEDGGNPKTSISLLDKAGFFCNVPITEVRTLSQADDNTLDHTQTALRMSGLANGVSKIHQQTLQKIWKTHADICPIISITNAQHFGYWADKELYAALSANDDVSIRTRKLALKEQLFEQVADENGEIFRNDILTIVFAKRFTGYKRADLLLHDMDRFNRLISNKDRPIQIIWAGKPYPMDYAAIGTFDKIVNACKTWSNCSILSGYELRLSKQLKQGADIWLNLPRLFHEASGTSGMTAAMNGAVNVAIPDGWFPEFARDKQNSFIIPASDPALPEHIRDENDANALYDLLEKEVIPMYYDYPDRWTAIIKQAMHDILPYFDSNRMATEYYQLLYNRSKQPVRQ